MVPIGLPNAESRISAEKALTVGSLGSCSASLTIEDFPEHEAVKIAG